MSKQLVTVTYPGIRGQLRITSSTRSGSECRIYIEGDPAGLRSLAALFTKLADVDQTSLPALPNRGASEHVHLERSKYLTPQSVPHVVIGRLDDKTGAYDETFVPRDSEVLGDITHVW